jgi:hypothetical protein
LTVTQVLTGELPFRHYRDQELAYYVTLGARPELPANAKDIGISDSLWELMQKCWDGKITQRPRIKEVVKGVGEAAVRYNKDMPPSPFKPGDTPDDEESDYLKHGGFPPFLMWYPPYLILLAAEIFNSRRDSETLPLAGLKAGTSRLNDKPTARIQHNPVETPDEPFELVYKHLDQNNPPSVSLIPPKPRKGFRFYLKKIPAMLGLGRNSKH